MPSAVSGELVNILTENFEVVAADISPDRTLDDLDVDSVSFVELVDILQEKYEIKIGDDELTNKNTVQEVIGVVTVKVGA
jgi:acyl carrier protein